MKTIKFKCTLKSDIILSEFAATDGIQRTLDYIPGSVFLGIAARRIYKEMNDETMRIFHSGEVRFGDAHPLQDGKRAIRVPASWHVKKGESLKSQVYNHHDLPKKGIKDENGNPQQPKQCRGEFVFKANKNYFGLIEQEKNFAIKSAHNKETRRSKDQSMYGYQSLEAGSVFCFQVDFIDDSAEELINKVKGALIGNASAGRSKTAQYGQVKISMGDFNNSFEEYSSIIEGHTFLYAESRLLFLDEFGQPTANLTGELLGMSDAVIDLAKSQIRTFRYAPYNTKRQSRDADRYGIEKGSVICLKKKIEPDKIQTIKKGIGLYKNEGFGKVLINPEFLSSENEFGKAKFLYKKPNCSDAENKQNENPRKEVSNDIAKNPVFQFLQNAKKAEDDEAEILNLVNGFVNDHKAIFQKDGETFSSQWGTIRVKAMQAKDKAALFDSLFSEVKNNEGYLVSGVSASKWEGKRIKVFKDFFNKKETNIKTIINLAAQMAKVCQIKGGGK